MFTRTPGRPTEIPLFSHSQCEPLEFWDDLRAMSEDSNAPTNFAFDCDGLLHRETSGKPFRLRYVLIGPISGLSPRSSLFARAGRESQSMKPSQ